MASGISEWSTSSAHLSQNRSVALVGSCVGGVTFTLLGKAGIANNKCFPHVKHRQKIGKAAKAIRKQPSYDGLVFDICETHCYDIIYTDSKQRGSSLTVFG